MIKRLSDKIWQLITDWLSHETPASHVALSDFDRLRYEIRFCDVVLVEGRSRVSGIIQSITLSPWTHSAIYLGRLHAIDDPDLRELIQAHYPAKPDEQLILEAMLGEGIIVAPLAKYQHDHLRLCRPNNISRKDAQAVISHAASRLGSEYDIRQLLDLARFFFPYKLLPRRWRSSLFGVSNAAKTVCSTMLAEAFASTRFPVRPVLQREEDGSFTVYNRNLKLYTPSDFDYSPYFDIIKYPVYGVESPETYRNLPWTEYGVTLEQPETKAVKAKSTSSSNYSDTAELTESEELAQQAKDLLDDIDKK